MQGFSQKITTLQDDLRETGRYTRSRTSHCRYGLTKARIDLMDLADAIDAEAPPEHALKAERCRGRLMRLTTNLFTADHFLQVSPTMAEGYIEGAVFEPGVLRTELEKLAPEPHDPDVCRCSDCDNRRMARAHEPIPADSLELAPRDPYAATWQSPKEREASLAIGAHAVCDGPDVRRGGVMIDD